MDPASKFILAHVQGARDEALIRRLLEDGAARLHNRHAIALFTDGLPAYRTLFPEIFGYAYYPPRQGARGPHPQARFRIPRSAAHVQIVKHQSGYRLKQLDIRYAHGSQKRIRLAWQRLGYQVPNTSALERRNGTARLMSAAQVRKSLAFAGKDSTKEAMGWWATTVCCTILDLQHPPCPFTSRPEVAILSLRIGETTTPTVGEKEMEEEWVVDRARLRELLPTQPHWRNQEYTTTLGRSLSWVKKWKQRLEAAEPRDDTVLHSQSRARLTAPPPIAPLVVTAILRIRDEPPDSLRRTPGPLTILYFLHRDAELQAGGCHLPTSHTTVWKILDRHQRIAHPPVPVRQPIERPGPMAEWQVDFKDVPSACTAPFRGQLVWPRFPDRVHALSPVPGCPADYQPAAATGRELFCGTVPSHL